MKKLKTTFTALVLAGSLLLSTGVAGAAELKKSDEPIVTYFQDPGTGGDGR